MRVVCLISGDGSNLQALIDWQLKGLLGYAEIVGVVSNKVEAFGLECAKRSGALLKQIIARTSILTPQSTAAFERQQRRCLERFPIDARPHVEGLSRLARPYLPVETQ